jgi:hypothetical protein
METRTRMVQPLATSLRPLSQPTGPFREVQLLIDGVLAGVIFPYRRFSGS